MIEGVRDPDILFLSLLHVIMASLTHTVYIMVSLLGLLISSLSYTTICNGIRKARCEMWKSVWSKF